MFTSNFKEKSAPEIELPGKKAGNIEQLLDFIYPDKDFILSRENWFSLFKLANEYQIERLMAECQNFLSDWFKEGMSGGEALAVIVYSQAYSLDEKTVRRCKYIIATRVDKAWQEIKQNPLFAGLKPETVLNLMEKRIAYLEDQQNVGNESYLVDRILQKAQGTRSAKRSRVF